MKKLFLTIIVVLVAAFLLCPLFVGKAAEKQFNALLAQACEESGIAFSNVYHRRWFNSTAETSVDLREALAKVVPHDAGDQLDIPPIIVNTKTEISHGPFPAKRFYPGQPRVKPVLAVMKNVTTINFPPDVLDITPSFTTYTTLYPSGAGEGVFTIPETHYSLAESEQINIDIQEVTGCSTFSSDLSMKTFSVDAPGARLSTAEMDLSIEDVHLDARSRKGESNIPLGTSNFRVGRIFLKEKTKDAGSFGLTECSVATSSDEKDGAVSSTLDVSFKEADIDGEKYGPATVTLSVVNIDAAAMMELQKAARDFRKAQSDKAGSQLGLILLMAKINALLPEFVKRSPEFEISKCSLDSPFGTFSASAKAVVDGAAATSFSDIGKMLNAVDAKVDVTIPTPFADKYVLSTNAPLAETPLQGIMVKEGDAYEIHAVYKEGKLLINGKPFPPMPQGSENMR